MVPTSNFGSLALGKHSPHCCISYLTSFSGGKSGVPTISTDDDYTVLAGALCKKPMHTNVFISFDLDAIAAFKKGYLYCYDASE